MVYPDGGRCVSLTWCRRGGGKAEEGERAHRAHGGFSCVCLVGHVERLAGAKLDRQGEGSECASLDAAAP